MGRQFVDLMVCLYARTCKLTGCHGTPQMYMQAHMTFTRSLTVCRRPAQQWMQHTSASGTQVFSATMMLHGCLRLHSHHTLLVNYWHFVSCIHYSRNTWSCECNVQYNLLLLAVLTMSALSTKDKDWEASYWDIEQIPLSYNR